MRRPPSVASACCRYGSPEIDHGEVPDRLAEVVANHLADDDVAELLDAPALVVDAGIYRFHATAAISGSPTLPRSVLKSDTPVGENTSMASTC